MLQQTRIDQGTSYFFRFMEAFPDVFSLAEASEEQVLRLWQGLGYYSRARNLHKAARDIVTRRGGRLPESFPEWMDVRGVGPYTAAAIASMAYGEPVPALDGNGYRVLSRIFAVDENIDTTRGRKTFQELGAALIDRKNPGDFNQALMDFGSMICKPSGPLCSGCIFQRECLAFTRDAVARYPMRRPGKKPRERYFNYFLFYSDGNFLISRRTGQDIWKNLFELPLLETAEPLQGTGLTDHPWWMELFPGAEGFLFTHLPVTCKHLLTHQTIHATFFRVKVHREAWDRLKKIFIPSDEKHFDTLPKPRLIERFFLQTRNTG